MRSPTDSDQFSVFAKLKRQIGKVFNRLPGASSAITYGAETNPANLRLGLVRGVSLFFAFATATGVLLRSLIAPLPPVILAIDVACFVGFLIAYFLAAQRLLILSGIATLASMATLIVFTGYAVGGLISPVFAILPLIPITANLLINSRAGWIVGSLVVFTLAALVVLESVGVAMPAGQLDEQQFRFARAIMLAITCLLATAVVWYYEQLQARLHVLALHDPLTGVANRGFFDSQLVNEFSRATRSREPLSLLMIDIDQFKAYNDSLGHQKGDACLIEITRAIAGRSRRAGDFFARYGGEEFTLILPGTFADDAYIFAETLRRKIAALSIHHPACEQNIVTVSIGVATLLPTASDSPAVLIANADAALYKAKAGGRNCTVAYRAGEAATAKR